MGCFSSPSQTFIQSFLLPLSKMSLLIPWHLYRYQNPLSKFVMITVCCGLLFFVLHSHMQRVNALANTPGWWTRQEQVPESERGRPRGKALQSQRNLLFGNLLYHQLCLGKRVGCSSWHSYLLFLGLYVFFAFWYQNLSFELYDAIAICDEPWRVFRKINNSNMNC